MDYNPRHTNVDTSNPLCAIKTDLAANDMAGTRALYSKTGLDKWVKTGFTLSTRMKNGAIGNTHTTFQTRVPPTKRFGRMLYLTLRVKAGLKKLCLANPTLITCRKRARLNRI